MKGNNKMKSKVYNYEGKCFRYDYQYNLLEYISKADMETIREEEEWKATHNGRGLFDIDSEGYYLVDSIGLREENWKNKETRNEYLSEWMHELHYEAMLMAKEFIS